MSTFHQSVEEILFGLLHCKHYPSTFRRAPARKTKRRRGPQPAWAKKLLEDPLAAVEFDEPIPCPSCGIPIKGLEAGLGEVGEKWRDVIQCDHCLAPFVLDLRRGTLRAPTEHERKTWRLTFWFGVLLQKQGD